MPFRKPLIYLLILSFFSLMAQSCMTAGKGCGCGNDLNRTYKPKNFR